MGIKVKQRDITDCGAACLASVASFYKLEMPVARIRQIAGTDTKGTNVFGMIKAAESSESCYACYRIVSNTHRHLSDLIHA